jgi:hypothetical protein
MDCQDVDRYRNAAGDVGIGVIARHIIVGRGDPKKDGTTAAPVLYAQRDLVLGIYSGRHYPDFARSS